MLEFKAAAFYDAVTGMQATELLIKERAPKTTRAKGRQSMYRTPINDPVFVQLMIERGAEMQGHLVVLGAKITSLALDELAAKLQGTYKPTFVQLADEYREIGRNLRRELSLASLFALNDAEIPYFSPKHPLFGKDFDGKFRTKGIFELDEAAKCMALGRPTAGVFHLMRIMEIGIEATRKCLGIPDPVRPYERTWGEILKKIKDDGIAKKWPTKADRMAGDGALFDALHASLDAVKTPLRDSTMHIENIYTDAEAKHIFELVKGFMMKLASRMDENGLPLA